MENFMLFAHFTGIFKREKCYTKQDFIKLLKMTTEVHDLVHKEYRK